MSDLTSSYTHQSSPKDAESVFLIQKKEEQLKLGSKKKHVAVDKKKLWEASNFKIWETKNSYKIHPKLTKLIRHNSLQLNLLQTI